MPTRQLQAGQKRWPIRYTLHSPHPPLQPPAMPSSLKSTVTDLAITLSICVCTGLVTYLFRNPIHILEMENTPSVFSPLGHLSLKCYFKNSHFLTRLSLSSLFPRPLSPGLQKSPYQGPIRIHTYIFLAISETDSFSPSRSKHQRQ